MNKKKTPEYYSDLSLLKFCVFLGIIVNLAIYNENINHSFDIFTKYTILCIYFVVALEVTKLIYYYFSSRKIKIDEKPISFLKNFFKINL